MKRVKVLVLSLAMMVSLAGCIPGIGGNSLSQAEVSKNLIVGITTQEDVRKMYGEPTEISKSSNGDVWKYIEKPSAIGNMFSSMAQSTGMAAVGQASAHAGLAVADKGGVLGAAAASSAVNSLGSEATETITSNAQYTDKVLTIYFDKRKIVRRFFIN